MSKQQDKWHCIAVLSSVHMRMSTKTFFLGWRGRGRGGGGQDRRNCPSFLFYRNQTRSWSSISKARQIKIFSNISGLPALSFCLLVLLHGETLHLSALPFRQNRPTFKPKKQHKTGIWSEPGEQPSPDGRPHLRRRTPRPPCACPCSSTRSPSDSDKIMPWRHGCVEPT